MTKEERERFMYLQGLRYAGQGSKFADYRDALEAFASFALFYSKPWAKDKGLEILASDFEWFQTGYQKVEVTRHELQLQRAEADKELKQMLAKYF